MTRILFLPMLLMACASLLMSSCGSSADQAASGAELAQRPAEAAPGPVGAPSAQAPAGLQPPYPITDSSRIFTVEGIGIYIAEEGSGTKPKPGSNVVMNYRGTLLNGEEFDSSFGKGGYMDFSLNNLIQGWQIALPLVPTGSKVKLIIPADKGYGPADRPGIPGNSTLVFDIELVSSY
ncbi:MAG: FKBP-type peptidyl-prolyl cis-trans isomerase [Bacteroidia bacterium]|nr:FKBP-type peptidyl-prolyl cis-trans isomerase [Bacteroidia bacterium]